MKLSADAYEVGAPYSMNHCSQAWFHRLWCSFEANADENAVFNIAERFSDEKLILLPFRDVEKTWAIWFMRRLPDARSASAWLELTSHWMCREVRWPPYRYH